MLNSILGYFGTHNLSVLLHLSHMTFEILLALTEKIYCVDSVLVQIWIQILNLSSVTLCFEEFEEKSCCDFSVYCFYFITSARLNIIDKGRNVFEFLKR